MTSAAPPSPTTRTVLTQARGLAGAVEAADIVDQREVGALDAVDELDAQVGVSGVDLARGSPATAAAGDTW